MSEAEGRSPGNNAPSLVGAAGGRANLPAAQDASNPQLGRYPAFPTADQPTIADSIRAAWRIFNKRKWLIIGITTVFLATTILRMLMLTPVYSATVRIQIDQAGSKILDKGEVSQTEDIYGEFLKTQYELLMSRSLAERVVSATRIAENPEPSKGKQFSILGYILNVFGQAPGIQDVQPLQTLSQKDRERAIAGMVVNNVAVRPVSGSRLVDITYTDPNPGRAQLVANAYAEAYIASNLDKRFEANSYAKTFLDDQIKQLKLRLQESEKALLDFAQKEQIDASTDKSSIAENNLAAANAALGALISERIKNEQQWKQVEAGDAINLPQLLTNAVIDGLRAKKNALVTEYQEKLETFKPSYPAMVQISNKIAEIDRQLSNEVKTIRGSLKAAFESSLSQENELKSRIETLRGEALELQRRSIQYNILKRETDSNREIYNSLLQRFKEVDVAGGSGANNVFIVDKAELPRAPNTPPASRGLLLALVMGLGLGFGIAYVLEGFDDLVVTIEDIEKLVGLATLGVIPRAAEGMAEIELQDPTSAISEAYRSLCTSLQFTTERGLPKTIMVTSSGPGEGKSITALAIAQHFARMGLKVLVIDADLRNPSLHKKMTSDNSKGLSNYLIGACTPPEAMQQTDIANLAFMSSGPLPPNAADLLGSSRLVSLLSLSLEVFDLVMVDAPPILGLADAPILANATEATVFVVASGQARRATVVGAMKRLEMSKAPLIGTVLTKFKASEAGYGYGYGYGTNAYSYGSETAIGGLTKTLLPSARVGAS